MNSIVILCILGVVKNQQAEGCNPYVKTTDVINTAQLAMADLQYHIAQLKMDFLMEITQMKMNETTKIYSIMSNTLSTVLTKLMTGERNVIDAMNCTESWDWHLYRASMATAMELKKCVMGKPDIFRNLESHIGEFLVKRAYCLLDLDDVRVGLCQNNTAKSWNECVTIATSIDPITNIPLTCEYKKYITELQDLKSNATSLFETGKADVHQCLGELEGKYNNTIKPIIELKIRCPLETKSN